ncbi:MAG: hypothetical protein V3W31_03450, partial [Thermodesulfobacteriota bacterium]
RDPARAGLYATAGCYVRFALAAAAMATMVLLVGVDPLGLVAGFTVPLVTTIATLAVMAKKQLS